MKVNMARDSAGKGTGRKKTPPPKLRIKYTIEFSKNPVERARQEERNERAYKQLLSWLRRLDEYQKENS
jgi:hypothetical protein